METRQLLSGITLNDDTAQVVAGESTNIEVTANDAGLSAEHFATVQLSGGTHGTVSVERYVPAWLASEFEYYTVNDPYAYSSINDYMSSYYSGWDSFYEYYGNPSDAARFLIQYTANDPDYAGQDSISYSVQETDGTIHSASVLITISPNQAPDLTPDNATVTAGETVILDLIANDSDPEGTDLQLVSVTVPGHGLAEIVRYVPASLQSEFESQSQGGYYSSIDHFVSDYYGGWDSYFQYYGNAADSNRFVVKYQSTDSSFSGQDSFSYLVADAVGKQSTGTVTINVLGNAAPVVMGESATLVAGGTISIDVLANDVDPEGTTLLLISVTGATHGSSSITRSIPPGLQSEFQNESQYGYYSDIDHYVNDYYGGWSSYFEYYGNPADANRFLIQYNSTDASFSGQEILTYVVEDQAGMQSSGQLTLTVTENLAPVVAADSATVIAGGSVLIDVLLNDVDPEGTTLSIGNLGSPTNGTAALQRRVSADLLSEYAYNDEYGYYASIDDYVASYYGSWESYAQYQYDYNGITVDINQFDLLYTSTDSGYSGTDSFTYEAVDADGNISIGIVTVDVTGNLPPVAGEDQHAVSPGGSITIDVLANDNDPEGTTLRLLSVSTAAFGVAQITRYVPASLQSEFEYEAQNGYYTHIDQYVSDYYGGWDYYFEYYGNPADANRYCITYQATAPDYNGLDSFTYQVEDAAGQVTTGTVTITIGTGVDEGNNGGDGSGESGNEGGENGSGEEGSGEGGEEGTGGGESGGEGSGSGTEGEGPEIVDISYSGELPAAVTQEEMDSLRQATLLLISETQQQIANNQLDYQASSAAADLAYQEALVTYATANQATQDLYDQAISSILDAYLIEKAAGQSEFEQARDADYLLYSSELESNALLYEQELAALLSVFQNANTQINGDYTTLVATAQAEYETNLQSLQQQQSEDLNTAGNDRDGEIDQANLDEQEEIDLANQAHQGEIQTADSDYNSAVDPLEQAYDSALQQRTDTHLQELLTATSTRDAILANFTHINYETASLDQDSGYQQSISDSEYQWISDQEAAVGNFQIAYQAALNQFQLIITPYLDQYNSTVTSAFTTYGSEETTAYNTFQSTLSSAEDAYNQTSAGIEQAYNAAMTAADSAYNQAEAQHLAAYETAIAAASATFDSEYATLTAAYNTEIAGFDADLLDFSQELYNSLESTSSQAQNTLDSAAEGAQQEYKTTVEAAQSAYNTTVSGLLADLAPQLESLGIQVEGSFSSVYSTLEDAYEVVYEYITYWVNGVAETITEEITLSDQEKREKVKKALEENLQNKINFETAKAGFLVQFIEGESAASTTLFEAIAGASLALTNEVADAGQTMSTTIATAKHAYNKGLIEEEAGHAQDVNEATLAYDHAWMELARTRDKAYNMAFEAYQIAMAPEITSYDKAVIDAEAQREHDYIDASAAYETAAIGATETLENDLADAAVDFVIAEAAAKKLLQMQINAAQLTFEGMVMTAYQTYQSDMQTADFDRLETRISAKELVRWGTDPSTADPDLVTVENAFSQYERDILTAAHNKQNGSRDDLQAFLAGESSLWLVRENAKASAEYTLTSALANASRNWVTAAAAADAAYSTASLSIGTQLNHDNVDLMVDREKANVDSAEARNMAEAGTQRSRENASVDTEIDNAKRHAETESDNDGKSITRERNHAISQADDTNAAIVAKIPKDVSKSKANAEEDYNKAIAQNIKEQTDALNSKKAEFDSTITGLTNQLSAVSEADISHHMFDPHDVHWHIQQAYDFLINDGLDMAVNFTTGWADALTGGFHQRVRQSLGIDNGVDYDSGLYTTGQFVGTAQLFLLGNAAGAAGHFGWGYSVARAWVAGESLWSGYVTTEAIMTGGEWSYWDLLNYTGIAGAALNRLGVVRIFQCFTAETPVAVGWSQTDMIVTPTLDQSAQAGVSLGWLVAGVTTVVVIQTLKQEKKKLSRQENSRMLTDWKDPDPNRCDPLQLIKTLKPETMPVFSESEEAAFAEFARERQEEFIPVASAVFTDQPRRSKADWFRKLLLIVPLLFACLCFWNAFPGWTETKTAQAVVRTLEPTKPKLATIPISEIKLGQRTIGRNPDRSDTHPDQPEPDPLTWREIHLSLGKPNGSEVQIELLRPISWLEYHQATTGDVISLDLPEMGAQGFAIVKMILPCPEIEPDVGEHRNVVTGRFVHHSSGNLLSLYVDGEEQPIGVTDNHRFWSDSQSEFVEAGNLRIGEHLRLADGSTAKLAGMTKRARDELVYNLEVHGEHVYQVGLNGVLTHNTYPQELARSAASPYANRLLTCDKYTDDILNVVGSNGTRIDIQSRVGDFMISRNKTITRNGHHSAVDVDGLIFDNLNPSGITPLDWVISIESRAGFDIVNP
ncbi:Ig-like domain-containing protein [uncultured Rubinisphaera sp.]|uniref:Ig-like domain-containing protein n=1 Tax=uncultured Rubinisphaera sp. TaxID=1678686 RepID=UPI0030DD6F26